MKAARDAGYMSHTLRVARHKVAADGEILSFPAASRLRSATTDHVSSNISVSLRDSFLHFGRLCWTFVSTSRTSRRRASRLDMLGVYLTSHR